MRPSKSTQALKANRKRHLKKRYFLGLLSLLMITGGLLSQPRWIFTLAPRLSPGALYAVKVSPSDNNIPHKIIALTIDDGPSPATEEILAVLDQHNVKATFFNISGNLPGHEAIVMQAVASGHELGNHFTEDFPSIRLSTEAFETDLLAAEQALLPYVQSTEANGTEVEPNETLRWLRPGMGFYNSRMVNIGQRHGYQIVLGSRFPYDTHIPSSRFASTFILRTVQPGDIIVLHDGGEGRGERTIQTLKTILPALQKRGYIITTVGELTETSAQQNYSVGHLAH
ncbi:MAG: chitin deacetylase family protein [Cyanobacteria bacterium P01_F01_bin.3]